MATIFTDDFTAADGSAWSSNWSITTDWAAYNTVDISSNQGRMLQSTSSTSRWEKAVDTLPSRGDQELSVFLSFGQANFNALLGVRMSGINSTKPSLTRTGVYLLVKNSSSVGNKDVELWSTLDGTATKIATVASLSYTQVFTPGYNYRIRALGDTVSVKVWLATDTEPDWTDYTISGLSSYPAGNVMLGREPTSSVSSTGAALFDNVVVTDATDSLSVTVDVAPATMTLNGVDGAIDLYQDTAFDAGTVTASVASVEPTSIISGTGISTSVSTVTASITSVDADVHSMTVDAIVASREFSTNGSDVQNTSGNVVDSTYDMAMDFELPEAMTNSGLVSALLNINVTVSPSSTDYTYTISPITQEWADTATSYVTGEGKTFTASNGSVVIDVTDLIDKPNFYGFVIDDSNVIDSNKYIVVSSGPTLTVSYEIVPEVVAIDASTATVSLNAMDASAGGNISVALDTATASLSAFDADVSTTTTPNAGADVETATVSLVGGNGDVSVPVIIDMDTENISVVANDPTAETYATQIIDLDTPVIIQTLIGLTDVNGEPIVGSETDDRYFVATSQSSPSIWFRLNEKSGTEVIDRVSQQPAGDYHGVTIGMYNAPEGRQSVYFNGSAYISQREPTGSNQDEQFGTPRTLEFNMRTDKQSQFIAGGVDLSAPSKPEFSPGTTYPYEFWLKDGKINYRHWTMNSSTGVMTQTDNIVAFTNIADGKWHNIVITAGGYNSARSASYMDIYIDGKLEIRRFISGIFGFPDFIGGRPEAYRGYPSGAPALPGVTEWFVGDMTEISLRNNVLLTEDQISLQRDTFFGVYPIYTETPTITSTSYEASIKGNKPRVLILEFGPHTATGGESLTYLPLEQPASYVTEVGGNITVNYPGLQSQFGSGDDNSTELYQFFTVSTRGSNYQYTDEVTGNERLIDLDKDINLDDFDILAINNYPQTGAEREFWYDNADTASVAPYIPMRVQLENLMAQIRQKVIEGKRLFVNDPASAVALGIISNFDMVPTMEEQFIDDKRIGSFTDIYDYHAAKIDPWGNPQHTDETALDHASRYQDTHNNTFQRVRTLVPGLTDIPSWIVEDRVAWYNVDPLGNPPAHESMKVVEKADGLSVGDEFYMLGAHGPSFMDWFYDYGISGPRVNGWPAARVSDVQVGTVVTTFGKKLYNFNATPTNQDDDFDTVVDNPYNTYAVSVVVEPGTVWDGQEVTGKVYMNFTEGFTNWATFIETMSLNIYNEAGNVGSVQYITTDEQREWRYSTHAGNYSGTDIIVPVLFVSNFYVDNSGRIRKTNKDATRNSPSGMITVYNWAPAFPQEVVDVLNMANRGLMWLGEDVAHGGGVLVAAETAEVNVETTGATVSASVNETVDLSTARVNVNATEMSDVVPTEATVLVGTPTLTVKPGAFIESVDVSTAQITVNIVEPESDLFNNVDMITLVLPAHSITLQMEDN